MAAVLTSIIVSNMNVMNEDDFPIIICQIYLHTSYVFCTYKLAVMSLQPIHDAYIHLPTLAFFFLDMFIAKFLPQSFFKIYLVVC